MSFSTYASTGGPFSHLEPKAHTQSVDFKANTSDNSDEQTTAGENAEKPTPEAVEQAKPAEETTDEGQMPDADTLNAARAEGAAAERARCAAIFAAPASAHNIEAAAHMAFETDLPAEAAIGMISKFGKPAAQVEPAAPKRSLSADMANQPKIDIGQPATEKASGPKGVAEGILAAHRMVTEGESK